MVAGVGQAARSDVGPQSGTGVGSQGGYAHLGVSSWWVWSCWGGLCGVQVLLPVVCASVFVDGSLAGVGFRLGLVDSCSCGGVVVPVGRLNWVCLASVDFGGWCGWLAWAGLVLGHGWVQVWVWGWPGF